MFGGRVASVRLKLLRSREFCTNKNKPTEPNNQKKDSDLSKHEEQYRQLQNLDFITAAKMVFSEPAKKRKFGIDFHLVQLLFACLPSLAVYLVAQYARKEMRKMDVEFERKKKEEEEKAKEIEAKAIEEKEAGSAELCEVKVRLNKLEETISEIVVESKKKRRDNTVSKGQEDSEIIAKQDGSTPVRPEPEKRMEKDEISKHKPEEKTSGSGGGTVTESPPPSRASRQE